MPVSFPKVATDAFGQAKTMTVTATPNGGGEAVRLPIALNGFTRAFKRIAELAK